MFKKVVFLVIALFAPFFPFSLHSAEEKMDIKIHCFDRPHIVTAFNAILNGANGKTLIDLNDGSRWLLRHIGNATLMLPKDDSQWSLNNDASEEWRKGDDIRIGSRKPINYPGTYILKNARTGTIVFVDLHDTSSTRSIKKMGTDGYAIITSDAMQWAVGWAGSFTTRKWKCSDRMIMNKSDCAAHGDYQLFNLDKKTDAWATLIDWIEN